MTAAAQHKRAWSAGDTLTWQGGLYHFVRFDPEYPRAIVEDRDALVNDPYLAIDIRTAKRVTKDQLYKRAERQRRRDAGETRAELWLTQQQQSDLSAIMDALGLNQAEAICWAIGKAVGR